MIIYVIYKKKGGHMDKDQFISSFLKIIALDHLDLSEIEPCFIELQDDDEHLGYLDEGEKALYLICLFCERQVAAYQYEQEKITDKYQYFEELAYWNHKSSIASSLLEYSLRLRFKISYRYDMKVVEDFLAAAYIAKKEIVMLMN